MRGFMTWLLGLFSAHGLPCLAMPSDCLRRAINKRRLFLDRLAPLVVGYGQGQSGADQLGLVAG
ncbi:hypothetical protein JD81_00736 [Micromonospora sagamiensis]|uniref:Uncharacterized protein n=1 Tax=Micromonospora sagamiensis TaxID=47875 RepID=A0A562WAD4_9ACTN|nr:hypothetical protein JD81_00736 [Micromonospora sagamiensis]